MNSDKLFKTISIAFCSTFVTTVVVVPTAIAVAENNRKPSPEGEFDIDINIPEGEDVHFSNTKATIGEEFVSEVTSKEKIKDITIVIDDKQLIRDLDYTFNLKNTNEYVYILTVFAHAITSDEMSIDISTEPVVTSITITFDAGEGIIKDTSESKINLEFDSKITWDNISNKPEGFLAGHRFSGWTLTQGSDDPVPGSHLFAGDETVYAIYSDCEHEFDKYWVTEKINDDGSTTRRIHGHCSKCGAEDVELNDTELKNLEGSFLVKNTDQTYSLISDQPLSFYIGSNISVTEFDIYPIWGTYEINTSRGEGHYANVHLHGIHDLNGKITSALDSYNNEIEGEGTEGSIYYNLGISLYLDNMILQGRDYYDTYHGWSGGIQASYLSCEYCTLYGEMATYSAGNVFKHCHFDSTNFTSAKTDYSIYCYVGPVLFEDCSFVSDGKAIKLYNGNSPHLNEIYDCTFTIVDHVSEDKAAIEIDPTYCSASNKCVVYYDNVSLDETYAGLPLYHINTGLEGLVDLHPDERRTD